LRIREAIEPDFEIIWPIFHEIASAGETYAYPQDISKEEAKKHLENYELSCRNHTPAEKQSLCKLNAPGC
jgi:hypothetical protein